MHLDFTPKGVCARQMEIDVDDNGIITNVVIIGGCQGNLTGISNLVIGEKVDDIIRKLEGIQCGFKGTSCPDQLAKALKQMSK